MNEQTIQLLRDLASRLGTTTEYLWSVLIKQAPRSAISDLIMICIMVSVSYLSWAFLFKKYQKLFAPNDCYEYGIEYALSILVTAALMVATLAITLSNIENIISGLFNPEFWALQEILRKI
jgi:hypothetical protein